MTPADFIPSEYREFIYEDMTDEELLGLQCSMGFSDGGPIRHPSIEEVRQTVRKCIGVRDTRTGRVHWNVSNTPIMVVEVQR